MRAEDPGLNEQEAELVGRSDDLRRLVRLIRAGGVVNVHGTAGVGKSALVRTALDTVAPDYDSVHLADLSLPAGTTEWPDLLARSIGVTPAAADTRDALRIALAGRVLLVLDQAEAVVTAERVRDLVASSPGLQVVAVTVARLPGVEHVEVAPLARAEAEALFAARAAERAPGFRLDPTTAPDVGRICAAVEGLPLALELAAARLPVLPLSVLAREVTDSRALAVLSASRKGRIGVREALEGTLAHLGPSAIELFELTGCFTRSWSLDDLVGVEGGTATSDLYDDLSRLVDLRLVEHAPGPAESPRYRLPRLVRELAQRRLDTSDRADAVRDRHAEHFSAVARAAAGRLADAQEALALPVLKRDELELWSAMHWLRPRRPLAALRLVADLAQLADGHGEYEPARLTLNDLLLQTGAEADPATRRDALLGAGALAMMSKTGATDAPLIAQRIGDGTALARALDEPLALLRSLSLTALSLPVTGDLAGARLAAKEGIELARTLGHARWQARFEAWLGMTHHVTGDLAEAGRYGEQALHRALRAEDPRGIIIAGLLLHPMPADCGVDRSRLPSLEELLVLAERLDDSRSLSYLYAHLGAAALAQEDAGAAARWMLARLDRVARSGSWSGAGFVLMQVSRIAGLRGDDELAAALHGAVGPMLDVLVGAMLPSAVASYRSGLARVRDRLGAERFDLLAADGGATSWEDALVRAKAYLLTVGEPARPARSPTTVYVERLTPRELEVLGLIVRGRRNKEIAAQLYLAPKTVMHHAATIYRKLGVRGRSEAAVVALRDGLVEPPAQ